MVATMMVVRPRTARIRPDDRARGFTVPLAGRLVDEEKSHLFAEGSGQRRSVAARRPESGVAIQRKPPLAAEDLSSAELIPPRIASG